jgi:hypothetical protein
MDPTELARFELDWELTAEQWKQELTRAKNAWSAGEACEGTSEQIAACQAQNDVRDHAILETEKFISSLERNIAAIEEYKQFPEKLQKLLNIKQTWLEQILCNIEAISELMGGWVNDNGERFKAWVELFILIKAILKSWQLFVDVFNDYDAECHECKNERHDLNNFTFQLVSAVIPSPPIIEFPKWPDIILDLHHIRVGMKISMPEFEVNQRPLVLPSLPELKLPDVPSASFELPALPVIPIIELPELPELPALPTVELPDLPPPPKIPKLFGPVEAVLNIAKLITKVMCIMKGSPFVPEWRAGDQIAFLTERNGYIPSMDFIDLQPPSFSYSAISAIKVTSYVNLEFEMEFILEAARAITKPLNSVTSNIVSMWDYQISNMNIDDIDLSENVPENIDVELQLDGDVNTEISFESLEKNPEGIYMLAGMLAGKLITVLKILKNDELISYSNREFTQYMNQQLATVAFTEDQKISDLRALWGAVQDIEFQSEDRIIENLKQHNSEKFQTLQNIISTEIEHTKQQKESLKDLQWFSRYSNVSESTDSRVESYNTLLEPYNVQTLETALTLMQGESETSKAFREDLDASAKEFMSEVWGGLTSYKSSLLTAEQAPQNTQSSPGWTCIGNGGYEYRYEGIYILEDGKNYKLFDYTKILQGDEEAYVGDLDRDGDEDVLYLAEGKLFFKENHKQSEEKSYLRSMPEILPVSENVFYNGTRYYEAVNDFRAGAVSDGAINMTFTPSSRSDINLYRVKYHTIVDRYIDSRESYIPQNVEKHVIDALRYDAKSRNILSQNDGLKVYPQQASLIFSENIPGVTLTNEKFVNIRDDIQANKQVTLTRGTRLYATNRDFEISYRLSGRSEIVRQKVSSHTYAELSMGAEIVALSWDAYISTGIHEDISGQDLREYIGMPLSFGAKITFNGNPQALTEQDHLDIRYSDGSELGLDMREIASYTLYNLGNAQRDRYSIRLNSENDFYYARIQTVHENRASTLSEQILLAPQKEADIFAPELDLNQSIRIPVYQKQNVNLTDAIYEDGGLWDIADVWVDFDMDLDSDNDGNTSNDRDMQDITLHINPVRISLDFGPYENIFEKNIMLFVEDNNGNIAQKKVKFEVYAPNPSIESIEAAVISGAIDEVLENEPVRIYRYRWGWLTRLRNTLGEDRVMTDENGNYDFSISSTQEHLYLSYSGSNIAEIDEFSGKITPKGIGITTRVLPSNSAENSSAFPEIQILRLGKTLFRQYVMMPQGEAQSVENFDSLDTEGTYFRLIDQELYQSYRVPQGAEINPGSISVYQNTDAEKRAIMTIFEDGRVNIDETAYKLIYRSYGEYVSLVLVDVQSGFEIAQILYRIEGSYILK